MIEFVFTKVKCGEENLGFFCPHDGILRLAPQRRLLVCPNLVAVKEENLNTIILHTPSITSPSSRMPGSSAATRAADNSGFVSHYFTGRPPLMGSGTRSEALFLSSVKARLSSCLA